MYRMDSETVVDLLHPHLLPTSVLEALLKERKIGMQCINNASREVLLDLYGIIILPLPQREFRKNRRGILLAKKSKSNAIPHQEKSPAAEVKAKPKSLLVPSPDPQARLKPPPTTSKSISLHAVEPHSRLKPPPISAESGKVIKLNSKATNGSNVVASKRSMSPSTDSKRAIIKLNMTSQTSKSKDGRKAEVAVGTETGPPKKKHKPILWP